MSYDHDKTTPPDEHADCAACQSCGVHECECRCPDEPTGPAPWKDAYLIVAFETGETLSGQPSMKLLQGAHRNGADAVPAYCDEDEVWHYVAPERQVRELQAGREVIPVYVRSNPAWRPS
jgi:hypothetical protein